MLCGATSTALHEAEDKRINADKPDDQKITVYSHYSDKPIGRDMCKNCLDIYKKMPDWKHWADAVRSYSGKAETKSNEKQTKPKSKRTAKPHRADNKKDATKAKGSTRKPRKG